VLAAYVAAGGSVQDAAEARGHPAERDVDSDQELEADAFAGSILIPTRYDTDLARIAALAEVQAFARRIQVPPGIVVGRLQRDGKLGRDVGNRLRDRLRVGADGGIERV
jgi:hypothetical protein